MNNEQSDSSGYTKEEIGEAQAFADDLLKLWKSSKKRRYKFGAALQEFGESDYHRKIGFRSVCEWTAYMGISTDSAVVVRRIYRKLTLQRGIPVSDYAELDMAKTDGLMALIDAGPSRDIYLKALEVGAQTNLATWRVWIDRAIASINAGAGASRSNAI